MDDGFDIYGDLDEALIAPLQEEICKKNAIEATKELEEKKLKDESERISTKLANENRQLKENMSLLLATAKSEVERKDQQIKALRKELDDLIFRKAKVNRRKTMDKFTQTSHIHCQQRFTQTPQHNNSLLDPGEKLPLKDRREKSPRSIRNRWKSDESSKKLSYRDDCKYSKSRNREKSPERRNKSRHRHKSPAQNNRKESKERNSSNEKDGHRRITSKSPKRDVHRNEQNDRKSSRDKDKSLHEIKSDKKIDDNDLRIKLLKKKSNVEIIETKTENDKVNVESLSPSATVDHQEKNNTRIQYETDVNQFIELNKNCEPENKKEELITEEEENIKENNEATLFLIEKEQISTYNDNDNDDDEENNCKIYVQLEEPLNDVEIRDEHAENIDSVEEYTIQEILNIKHQNDAMKLEQVPLEVGPEYGFKEQSQFTEKVILELPLDNEETIYDSRDNKSPTNESFDSTKENSMNNSLDIKSSKRKIVTTEVESDGTVVFTIIRKKKRKVAKS